MRIQILARGEEWKKERGEQQHPVKDQLGQEFSDCCKYTREVSWKRFMYVEGNLSLM